MKKALEKLLRKLLLEKYPLYLDIRVIEDSGVGYVFNPRGKCFEVFLIILDKDLENVNYEKVYDFIINLAKYMDATICGVYNQPVSEEKWQEMKLKKKD